MKIKDVIKMVANLLQLGNVADADLDDFANLDEQTKKDINLIISCINMVLCDIATDYMPLKTAEQILVSDGCFNLKTLSKDFHKLISIDTIEKYIVENEVLKIKDGSYAINYSYLPKIYGIDQNSEASSEDQNEGENNSQTGDSGTIGDNYSVGGGALEYVITDDGEGYYSDSNSNSDEQVNDTIDDFDSRLTIYALSFGVASEFCLISGNYSESEMWNSKFQNAMSVCTRQIGVPSLKTRRWL